MWLNATKVGNFKGIKNWLNVFPSSISQMDYQRSFGSPLRFHSEIETGEKGIIEAVKYGHLDIVKYIMEKFLR